MGGRLGARFAVARRRDFITHVTLACGHDGLGRSYPGSASWRTARGSTNVGGGDEIGEAFFAKFGLQQDDLVDCINGAMALLVKIGDGLLGRAQNYGVAGDGSRRIAS